MPQVLEKSQVRASTAPSKKLHEAKERHLSFLLVCVAFLAIGAGVSLTGEFPINDDYIYTWSVRHLLETGQFKIPGTVASSIFPIYSGAGICALAGGFSYGLLRVLSFVFGLAGALGLYLALRQTGLKNRDSAIVCAAYLLNPLFVNVNFGFMTDVPALALNNWFLYFGLRLAKDAGRRFAWPSLLGAFAVVSLAVASRQTVFALLPAVLVLALRPGLSKTARVSVVVALLVWPALFYKSLEPVVLGACDYLVSYNGYKEFFANVLLALVKTPVAGFAVLFEQTAKVLSYLGLFCLPLSIPATLCVLFSRRATLKFWLPVLAVVAGLLAFPVGGLMAKHCLMPLSENLFCPPAVGTYCIISGGVPGWSEGSRTVLTYVAASAGAVLVWLLALAFLPLRRFLTSKSRGPQSSRTGEQAARTFFQPLLSISASEWFVIVAGVCSIGFLVVQTTVMNLDRYYLFALGPVLLMLALVWRRIGVGRIRIVAAALCAAMYVYSSITALDCMSFQRERWNALEYLVSCGVPALQIDGGPEFNYGYNMRLCEGYRMDKEVFGWPDSWRGAHPRNQWRWWPISGEKYIVSGSKLDDYTVVRTFPYFSPLKWRNRDIYVLKANEAVPH